MCLRKRCKSQCLSPRGKPRDSTTTHAPAIVRPLIKSNTEELNVVNSKVSSPSVLTGHPSSTRPSPPLRTMAKDYQRLWGDVTSTNDEVKAIRTLAEILLDKEGRSLISNLARKDAELCIEILDLVSRDPCLLPSVSDDFVRGSQSTTSELQRNRFSSSR